VERFELDLICCSIPTFDWKAWGETWQDTGSPSWNFSRAPLEWLNQNSVLDTSCTTKELVVSLIWTIDFSQKRPERRLTPRRTLEKLADFLLKFQSIERRFY